MRITLAHSLLIVVTFIPGCVNTRLVKEYDKINSVLNPVPMLSSQGSDEAVAIRGSVPVNEDESLDLEGQQNTFISTVIKASNNTDNVKLSKEMFLSGVLLSDRICFDWLKKLGEVQAHANQLKDMTTGLGFLTSSLLNVFEANHMAAAAAASGFSFIGTTLDASMANYIVSVDIPAVQRLITENRKLYMKTVINGKIWDGDENNKITGYYHVTLKNLYEYNELCSRNGVKDQLTRSVSVVADSATDNGKSTTTLRSTSPTPPHTESLIRQPAAIELTTKN